MKRERGLRKLWIDCKYVSPEAPSPDPEQDRRANEPDSSAQKPVSSPPPGDLSPKVTVEQNLQVPQVVTAHNFMGQPEEPGFAGEFELEPFEPLQTGNSSPGAKPVTSITNNRNAPADHSPPPVQESFNFDQADELIDQPAQSFSQQTQQEVDEFEKKLQHLLGGKVPQEYAEKLEVEQQSHQTTTSTPNRSSTIPDPKDDPSNPHAIFEQISEARAKSRMLDMGSFTAQLEHLNNLDNLLGRQQSKKKRNPDPSPQDYQDIPKNVEMTNMELLEDLNDMGVKHANPAITITPEEKEQPETIAGNDAPLLEEEEEAAVEETPETILIEEGISEEESSSVPT